MIGKQEHAAPAGPRFGGRFAQDIFMLKAHPVAQRQQQTGQRKQQTPHGPSAAAPAGRDAGLFRTAGKRGNPTGKKKCQRKREQPQQHMTRSRGNKGQQRIERARQQHAQEGKEIADAENTPLFSGCRTDLQIAGHRHDIQTAAHARGGIAEEQQPEMPPFRHKRHTAGEHQQQAHTDAGRRDGLPPVLPPTAGGKQRAKADTEHERAGKQACHGGAQTELMEPEGIDFQQNKDGKAVEKGIRAEAEENILARPQAQQIAGGLPGPEQREGGQVFPSGRCGPPRNKRHGTQAQQRNKHDRPGHQPAPEGNLCLKPAAVERRAGQRHPQQNGSRGGKLEKGIGLRNPGGREDFGQGAVQGGTEKRGARAHAEQHGQQAAPVQRQQAPRANQHGRKLKQLGGENDAPLGITIRQPAAPGGKENKGQGKEHRPPGLHARIAHADSKKQHGLLEEIVVECAQGKTEPQRNSLSGKTPAHTRSLRRLAHGVRCSAASSVRAQSGGGAYAGGCSCPAAFSAASSESA